MDRVSRGDRATISCSKAQQRRWKAVRKALGLRDHSLIESALQDLEMRAHIRSASGCGGANLPEGCQ